MAFSSYVLGNGAENIYLVLLTTVEVSCFLKQEQCTINNSSSYLLLLTLSSMCLYCNRALIKNHEWMRTQWYIRDYKFHDTARKSNYSPSIGQYH